MEGEYEECFKNPLLLSQLISAQSEISDSMRANYDQLCVRSGYFCELLLRNVGYNLKPLNLVW